MRPTQVLVVCLGNICRSPAAQGILESIANNRGLKSLSVDSAGTAAYHVGNSPDSRSIKALRSVGIDISSQKARKVTSEDFERFDWIMAMDRENLQNLRAIQPVGSKAKLVLFGKYRQDVNFGEVEDPYYGGSEGFTHMREHLQTIAESFISHILDSTRE